MCRGGLAILLVTGTLLPSSQHSEVFRLIARLLPKSSVIALNVGEMEADDAAYDELEAAIATPSCVLGHLYYRDPVTRAERERKDRVRTNLRRNTMKAAYLAQLARNEVWKLKGANCWHNFSSTLRNRALRYEENRSGGM